MKPFMSVLLIVLAVLTIPEGVRGQEPVVPPEQQEQLQAWYMELQQIQQQLAPVQQEVLEKPSIQAQQEELGELVQQAMEEEDPEVPQHMQRMQALEQEAVQAREAGDEQKLQELAAAAQEIQAHLMTAQAKALERPAIAARLEAFQDELRGEMIKLDPEAEALLDRHDELEAKLTAVLDPNAHG